MTARIEAGVCPACRSRSASESFHAGEYRFLRCKSCGLRFADPRPTPEALDDFYGSTYFDGHGWMGDAGGDSDYLRECWRGIRDDLNGAFPKRGRLLDVGCATGTLMIEATKDGWHCTGLEISDEASERARAAGLDVRRGVLADKPLAGQVFDVICSFHVIEHVIDPRTDLALMRDLAAPGSLAVLETPNADSVGYFVRRSRWAQIRPPEHIQFFNRRAMRAALEATGWRILKAVTIYREETAARLARRWWKGLESPARLAAQAVERVGMGGNLRVIARAV